jgi:hypothetical protein
MPSFYLSWLDDLTFPEDAKPERSKVVFYFAPPNDTLYANVDPGHPGAWRKAPILAQLLQWSSELIERERLVVVLVRDVATLILPNQSIEMGKLKPGDHFVLRKTLGPAGATYDVEITRV